MAGRSGSAVPSPWGSSKAPPTQTFFRQHGFSIRASASYFALSLSTSSAWFDHFSKADIVWAHDRAWLQRRVEREGRLQLLPRHRCRCGDDLPHGLSFLAIDGMVV